MTTTSTSPTAGQLWSRTRGLLVGAAILAIAGVAIAALRSGGEHGLLDPRSADPYGSRAVSELLADRGISTKVLTSSTEAVAQAAPGTTLLVPDPDSLTDQQRDDVRRAMRRSGRTVLVAPTSASIDALAPGVRAASPTPVQPSAPDCSLPAAERAGDADLGGYRYATKAEDTDACYLRQGLPTLLRLPHGPDSSGAAQGGDTVLLGAPDPLYNDRLDQAGNASLTLQLLGSHQQLLWYLPSTADTSSPQEEERGLFSLLPSGWTWGAIQLAFAALLAALWRARRLGPLVQERLPVSVPASEATEGRARLYRKANARDRAAEALRSATRTRLAPLVGVPLAQAHSPDALGLALAAHVTGAETASGIPGSGASRIRSLLFGPTPQDDAALVRLADELDGFERQITAVASATPSPRDKDRTP